MKKLRKIVLLSNDTVEAFTLPCPCGCSCGCVQGVEYSSNSRNNGAYKRLESKEANLEH